MAYEAAWPAAGQPFTVDDLDRLPDDGRRYELLDGVLIVSPRPTTIHQLAASLLTTHLTNTCPEDLYVIAEPAVQLTERTEFDPDIVVVRREDVGGAKFWTPPLLAVEIRSPSTAIVDRNAKLAAYEQFGVPSYWIFDPRPDRPELIVFELREGKYRQAAMTSGKDALRIDQPFSVEIVPSRLTLR
ncbi:MAG TPA: Uma2 family endonuclease [Streptosporangiaceae bacterium]